MSRGFSCSRLVLTLGLVVWGGLSAHAQNLQNMMGLFGTMMGEAQRHAAREAWLRNPPPQSDCLRRVLAAKGMDLSALAQSGIMPDDFRLNELKSFCARFSGAELRTGFSCSVSEGDRTVPSSCRQSFARRGPRGEMVAISPTEALDEQLAGRPPGVTEVEMPAARAERQSRADFEAAAVELRTLQAKLKSMRVASDAARRRHGSVLAKLERILGSRSVSSAQMADLRRDAAMLDSLVEAEAWKTATVERLQVAKAKIEQRVSAAELASFRPRAKELAGELAALTTDGPVAPPSAPVASVGPSFKCEQARSPFENLLCATPDIRRADLALYQPFYVLRFAAPDRQPPWRERSTEFSRQTQSGCKIPDQGDLSARQKRAALACVLAAYERQRDLWLREVAALGSAAANEEARRPIEEQVRLQGLLKTAGYLDAEVDGIFGGLTRRGIAAFQTGAGLPSDGFMNAATAEQLDRTAQGGERDGDGIGAYLQRQPQLRDRAAALEQGYAELSGRVATFERTRSLRIDAEAALTTWRRTLAAGPAVLVRDVPDQIDATLAKLRGLSAAGPDATAAMEREVAALKRRVDDASAALKEVGDRSGFLLAGGADDLLILLNDTRSAPSAEKGMTGKITFRNGNATACTPHEAITDRIASRKLAGALSELGVSGAVSMMPCPDDLVRGIDLLIVRRGELLRQPLARITPLLRKTNAGQVVLVMLIEADDLSAETARDERMRGDIEQELVRGTLAGSGALAIANGSTMACHVVTEQTAHAIVPAVVTDRVAEEFKERPRWTEATDDVAFRALKRGECGAVYARAEDLARIRQALSRDLISSRVVPVWINPGQPDRQEPLPRIEPGAPDPAAPASEAPKPRPPERRIALIIGNAAYRTLRPLLNPRNDAEDIARSLKELGFEVTLGLDASRSEMEDLLAKFSRDATHADAALAYFAGHGLQHNGVNYLVPVDGVLSQEADLRRFIKVQDLLTELERAPGVRILILDACRDNTALEALSARSRSAGGLAGLAPERAKGVLIAYSTQPNKVARDGEGQRNSPFTTALLRHLPTPGQDVRLTFTRVRKDVVVATDDTQWPETSDSLDGLFSFR